MVSLPVTVNGLRVWLVGYNYVKIDSVSVNDDNTYSYELKPADTENLASGQYLVIVQHPMMNGQFDIAYDPSIGAVIKRQLGSGTAIFHSVRGSLQTPDAGATSCVLSTARMLMIPLRPLLFT